MDQEILQTHSKMVYFHFLWAVQIEQSSPICNDRILTSPTALTISMVGKDWFGIGIATIGSRRRPSSVSGDRKAVARAIEGLGGRRKAEDVVAMSVAQ